MKKEWYDDAIEMPFENITIAVPIGYDGVLKAQFGDYMTPVQGTADHAYPFYKDMQRELGIRIKKSGFNGGILQRGIGRENSNTLTDYMVSI